MTRKLFAYVLLAVLASATVSLAACGNVVGSGNVKTETRNVSGFSGVALSGAGALNIAQTGVESLSITAEDNILPLITTQVVNNKLEISYQSGTTFQPTKPVIFNLTVKTLDALDISGAGNVTATGITATALTINLSGAGNISVSGTTQSQDVSLSGAGSYSARDLTSQNATVHLSGVGKATVTVSGTLDATVSGAGNVTYYGNPASVKQNISGIGSVKQGT
ncbi:MAG: hypothetical protein OJF49_001112 [Ktedonobacterales bacterium]|jgi:hypothetical protein|nr:MAG: hypothetical protein OJF49_001112 [Ktedonobacterales bacterium]